MKNVHVLSTEKLIKSAGDLVKDKYGSIHIFTKNDGKEYGKTTTKLNIYITSDEEIKEGDWFLPISGIGWKLNIPIKADAYGCNNEHCKKIILTTDQDLINDGVQAIDDEFLEWFVKNPSCEYVEIKKGSYNLSPMEEMLEKEYVPKGTFDTYKIIIPQEEFKHPKLFW